MTMWRNSLFILVGAMGGLALLSTILVQPHLQASIRKGGTLGNAVYLHSSSKRMGKLVAFEPQLSDMGTADRMPCNDLVTWKIMQAALDGPLLCPDTKGYNETVLIFNTRFKIRPAVVIHPKHEGDILVAMSMAAKHGLVVTVKNGGHNPAGFSLNEGGLVIDMKLMNRVWKEEGSSDLIRSQGGAKWNDVFDLMIEIGRSIVGGGCSSVGVVGLALGGGVGWMSRSRGLASDNMVEAKIVFPNGTIRVINDQAYPDLMWALRGAGGSNFGVVTEVALRTYPAQDKYFAGIFCFHRDPSEFRGLIELLRDLINGELDLDEKITMDLIVGRIPPRKNQPDHPQRVDLCWAGFYDGPIQDALATTEKLRNRMADLVIEQDACKMMRVECKDQSDVSLAFENSKEMIRSGEAFLQNHTFASWQRALGGDHLDVVWKSNVAEEFTEHMVDTTVKHFSELAELQNDHGAYTAVEVIFEHLGGAMKRNGNSISAWKHGNARVMTNVQSFIHVPFRFKQRGTAKHAEVVNYLKNWTDSYHGALALSSQGSYGNYADAELRDWEELYYGREIYARLKRAKDSIFGTRVFRSAQRIGVEDGTDVELPKEVFQVSAQAGRS